MESTPRASIVRNIIPTTLSEILAVVHPNASARARYNGQPALEHRDIGGGQLLANSAPFIARSVLVFHILWRVAIYLF